MKLYRPRSHQILRRRRPLCCAFIALHYSESQRITFYDITLYRVVNPISLNYKVHASYQSISVLTEKARAVHVMHAGPSRNWPVNEILSHNGASRLVQTRVTSKTAPVLIRTVRAPPLCQLKAVCPSALR